ncbi:hypothetical protein ACP4OV_028004 [Aristida adscensionis]
MDTRRILAFLLLAVIYILLERMTSRATTMKILGGAASIFLLGYHTTMYYWHPTSADIRRYSARAACIASMFLLVVFLVHVREGSSTEAFRVLIAGAAVSEFVLCFGSRLPAAWNYGAVEHALRQASERGERCIFEPEVGKKFDSPAEAFEFFNMYSWEVGFGIRYGRSRANTSGRKSRQDIVCSCEGHPTHVDGRSMRSGCPCMIRILRLDDGHWFVSRFVAVHNHPLAVTCAERRQWRSHSRIDQTTRDMISHLRSNNVQINKVCSIVGSMHGAQGYAPFSRQSIRSLCARLAQESIADDIGKTVELFDTMRSADPGLVTKVDVDENGRVKSLLWCHGNSKSSYRYFGDVVTFDTTYRTNLYNLPFGLFVGVNHHFQSVIFGAVLLTEETTESFRWAFTSFIEAMDGKVPLTILTDQCMAMKSAISSELPRTRHRWCKWHVLRKAKESLGPIYSKNFGFKNQLHELLDEVVNIQEFENKWALLVEEYNLQGNEFLERAYTNRKMWAKPYFADTFCAGMTSTQRSESANHLLKTYISRSSPMHLFVSQYNRLVADREAEEAREEHTTKQGARRLSFGLPIESHAAEVYTRKMFERFSRELYKSGAFVSHQDGDDAYRVCLLLPAERTEEGDQEFIVTSNPDGTDWFCVCKQFEHSGMPCCHVLRVLVQLGVPTLPSGLLLKRWSRLARDGAPAVTGAQMADSDAQLIGEAGMRSVAYAACMELISLCTQTRESFEVGIDYMSRAKAVITSLNPGKARTSAVPEPAESGPMLQESLAAPKMVRSRGRPKEGRFKSPLEFNSRKRRLRRMTDPGSTTTVSTEAKCRRCGCREHRGSKCRLGVVESPKKQTRSCKLCGGTGHYSSTCGRKSTYKSS